MVGYSEVRHTSPSIAFDFASLGALVESSSDPLGALSPSDSHPQIKGFVFSGNGLGLMFGDLYTFYCINLNFGLNLFERS